MNSESFYHISQAALHKSKRAYFHDLLYIYVTFGNFLNNSQIQFWNLNKNDTYFIGLFWKLR